MLCAPTFAEAARPRRHATTAAAAVAAAAAAAAARHGALDNADDRRDRSNGWILQSETLRDCDRQGSTRGRAERAPGRAEGPLSEKSVSDTLDPYEG